MDQHNFCPVFETPVGVMGIDVAAEKLRSLFFARSIHQRCSTSHNTFTRFVVAEVQTYFQNPGHIFDIPLHIEGSIHQKKVWEAIRAIPVTQTMTYSALAQKIGSASRAVAQACASNRLVLIIPCHRVVAKHGLGGFLRSTGQRESQIKKDLLSHELGRSYVG